MNTVYITGDFHGTDRSIARFYEQYKDTMNFDGTDVIICLGDFGGNYYLNKKDNSFKKKLKSYPFTYFIIRGNHEARASDAMERNPAAWKTEEYFGGEVLVETEYPHIKYALDYPSLYDIQGFSTLVLPGAYSVDKYYRLANNWIWHENEQLNNDEKVFAEKLCNSKGWKTDMVLSHTCPISFMPTDLFLSCIDQSMVDNSMERFLGGVEYKLDYKLWCFGHFHSERIYPKFDEKQMVMLYEKFISLNDVKESNLILY